VLALAWLAGCGGSAPEIAPAPGGSATSTEATPDPSASARSAAEDSAPAPRSTPAQTVSSSSSSAGTITVDAELPDYTPVSGVSGTIKSVGSDTMNNLMALWVEGFNKFYPNVGTEVEGKGSSTAPPALINGTANFGPMSRDMKPDEIDEFEQRYGYKPVGLPTSIDVLAVYVNKDNPIEGLSLAQVDAIFSRTRKLGHPHDITNWADLGGSSVSISLYGRNSASGTYGFFKENALGGGDFKDSVKEQPGSSSVVQGIARDRAGIGYSGIGYQTADVRAVPLAKSAGGEFVSPSPETVSRYPLARFLRVYVNYRPNAELDPLRREFIRFIFSKQGQEAVVRDGYIPVPAAVARKALQDVGLKPGF
jgi:phosphate transport system substrate-binding protein